MSKIYLSMIMGLSIAISGQALANTNDQVNVKSALKSPTKDDRVKEVIYNEDDITVVKVQIGTASLIQLGEGEFIGGANSGFAAGDPLAWDVSVKSNNIFLRPKAEQPDTNVIFTTNKRTYLMLLSSVKDGEDPTFVLRYKYPQDEHKKKQEELKKRNQEAVARAKRQAQEKAVPCTDGSSINMVYDFMGSQNIKPYAVWDDGRFTCFKWHSSVSLPVVYALDGNQERLTNSHMNKNIMVVHEVGNKFVLRAGDDVAEIKTSHNVPRSYNDKGTTTYRERLDNK